MRLNASSEEHVVRVLRVSSSVEPFVGSLNRRGHFLLFAFSPLDAAAIFLACCFFAFAADLTFRCFVSVLFVVASTARPRRLLSEPPDAHDRLGLRLAVVS